MQSKNNLISLKCFSMKNVLKNYTNQYSCYFSILITISALTIPQLS